MTWRAIHRIIHLPGGLRLLNRIGPSVEFDPGDGRGSREVLVLQHYDALFVAAAGLGVLPIGVEMVGSRGEQQGFVPTSFRSLDLRGRVPWPCGQQADEWNCLAHAASLENEPLLEDVASRISHELQHCDDLIFKLSKAYEVQRASALRNGKQPGARFVDGFTGDITQALEAFLVRSCVLRDCLAEFYAWTWRWPPTELRITSLGGLLKTLKKQTRMDAFAQVLSTATIEGGWLHTLGAYRDLIVHVSSISRVDGDRVVMVYEVRMENGLRPIAIRMPMPPNPTGLSKERSSGRFYTGKRHGERLNSWADDAGPITDALNYAAMALQNLAMLATTALTLSPIKPVMPHLGPDDILEIKIEDVDPPV
jgi:hypothetical protein